jgi:TP901 family phage tail tape measure protein
MAKKITVASYDIDIKSIYQKINELRTGLNNVDLGKGFSDKFTKELSKIESQLSKLENNMPGSGATSKQIATYGNKLADVTKSMSTFISELKGFKVSDKYILENVESLKEYINKLAEANSLVKQLSENSVGKVYEATSKGGKFGVAGGTRDVQTKMRRAAEEGKREEVISAYSAYSKDINAKMRQAKTQFGENSSEYQNLKTDRDAIHEIEQLQIKKAERVAAAIKKEIEAQKELDRQIIIASDNMKSAMEGPQVAAEGTVGALNKVTQEVHGFSESAKRSEESARSFEQIENKIKSLFSAGMVFQYIRRVVRGAIQDFQELDKQFNEIAIVSDYSTEEMWKNFSKVNKTAQDFGVTTNNVLEVQNLYYHQGKSMAEVNKLTAQTLTLAKITGMDYERATSDLTAALNAYNIAAEDAVRVTDTIAAMDTNAAISSEELMTALTKTASIAANAGMSLESTEVFLTKMIETTREAPENLGTALKTIIARFGEVKEEIDGEEIELADINRVDTALKSIGISLLDTAGQIRDLDDVFMELSSKWDDLDRNTQRYIATISAGSRQQSRFIAMMEDYDRTLELTEIAQESSGLGARQLAKSMESIETSLNRLKSTWQEFYSNVLTSGMVKDTLDILNSLLSTLNKMPGPLGAITTAVGGWFLKTKVLNKAILASKIAYNGLMEDLPVDKIVEKIETASKKQEELSFFKIIKERISAQRELNKESQEAEAIEDINDADNEKNIKEEYAKVKATEDRAAAQKKLNRELLKEKGIKGTIVVKPVPKTNSDKAPGDEKGAGGILSLVSNPKLAVAAAIITAIAVAIWGVYKAVSATTDDTKDIEALAKAQENYNNELKKYSSLKEKAATLEEYRSKQYKTLEDRQEEQELIRSIAEEYPILIDHIDEEGNYHLKNAEAIQVEIDKKKELAQQNLSTYNTLRIDKAKKGIYTDTSTQAGQSIENLQNYYAGFDDDALKELAKAIDSADLGGFSSHYFKKFAKAYAEGEKSSFGYKDFSNLFAGSITQEGFQALAEAYRNEIDDGKSTGEAIESALNSIEGYSGDLSKVIDAWTVLNEQTGNLYSDLLSGIGDEVENLYIQEGKIYVEDQLAGTDVNEKVKQSLAEMFAEYKEEEVKKINEEEQRLATTRLKGSFSNDWIGWLSNATLAMQGQSEGVATANALNTVVNAKSDEEIDREAKGNVVRSSGDYQQVLDLLKTNDETVKKLNEEFLRLDDIVSTGISVKKDNSPYYSYTADFNTGNKIFNDFLNKELAKREKMANDFIESVAINGKTSLGTTLGSFDLGELEVVKTKYDKLGRGAGEAFAKGLESLKDKGVSEDLLTDYLSINFSSIDDIVAYIEKLEKANPAAVTDEFISGLFGVAKAAGAISFGDVLSEAEKLQKSIDNITDSLEGLIDLATGKGDISGVGSYLNNLATTITDEGELTKRLNSIVQKTKYTTEGIQIGTSGPEEAAKEIVEARQAAIKYEVGLMKGELEFGNPTKERKLQLQAMIAEYQIAYGEVEAAYARAIHEKEIEDIKKTVEELKKKRDALKDYVNWLREYDRYANLDRAIDTLEQDMGHLEFEIQFSTNTDVIQKDLEETINNINTQIAANQGGIQAAQEDQAMWQDVISKKNKEYVSFDESGNAIVNAEKLQKLQEQISDAGEDRKEILQAEYDEIMANVDAYNKSKDKVEDYSKALEQNFKALEDTFKSIYESIKTVEDKLIEVRMAAEDKELEAVKEKYEAIKEEDNKYLDSVRKMIDKEREIRDRSKQEEDVKDKEKKLAMMKMDTSGVYATDIQSLEKELEQDYQQLEDDAVDRKIQELEDMQNAQAEAYDKEIEYLENNLEHKRELMTEYNLWATTLLQQGSDAVIAYLKANDQEYRTGSAASQALWEMQWSASVAHAEASNNVLKGSLTSQVIDTLDNCKKAAGGFEESVKQYSKTAKVQNDGVAKSVNTLTNRYKSLAGGVKGVKDQINNLKNAYNKAAEAAKNLADQESKLLSAKGLNANDVNPIKTTETEDGGYEEITTYTKGKDKGTVGSNVNEMSVGYTNSTYKMVGRDGNYAVFDMGGEEFIAVYMDEGAGTKGDDNFKDAKGNKKGDPTEGNYYYINAAATAYEATKEVKKVKKAKKYKTGGFADFTGPAWLDGTKSKPEAVLNALQTKHFIKFTNVLDTLFSNKPIQPAKTSSSQNSGDATYNFHINVDKMASDYDVDQLISRIEEKMVKASKYRNVTVIKNTK